MLESGFVVQFRVRWQKLLCPHPELRADGRLAPGRAHLQRFIPVSAADAFKEVIDEVEPAEGGKERGGMIFKDRSN